MTYRLAHLIIRPQTYMHGADVAATFAEAKKKGPLVGPVCVVRVAPFDLKHPLHSSWAAYSLEVRQRG